MRFRMFVQRFPSHYMNCAVLWRAVDQATKIVSPEFDVFAKLGFVDYSEHDFKRLSIAYTTFHAWRGHLNRSNFTSTFNELRVNSIAADAAGQVGLPLPFPSSA